MMSVLIDLLPLIVDGSMEYFFKNKTLLWELLVNHVIVVIDSVWLALVLGVSSECSLPTMTALGRASSGVRV